MNRYFFLFYLPLLWVLVTKVKVTSGQESTTTEDYETTQYTAISSIRTTTVTLAPSGVNNDFENGLIAPWTETSRTSVKWKVENTNSPWQTDNAAPTPLNGSSYVRVDRGASLLFGVAILRSPIFTVTPYVNRVTLSFSLWIRSKWPKFTNLEIYVAAKGKEMLAYSLSEYADINNLAWNSMNFQIHPSTFSQDFQMQVVFYAYCGTNVEDAIAIDDILLIMEGKGTTTPLTDSPVTTAGSTTSNSTTVTTAESTTSDPATVTTKA